MVHPLVMYQMTLLARRALRWVVTDTDSTDAGCGSQPVDELPALPYKRWQIASRDDTAGVSRTRR